MFNPNLYSNIIFFAKYISFIAISRGRMKLLGSVFTVLLPQFHAQLGGILDDAKYAEKYGRDWKSKKINCPKQIHESIKAYSLK